LERCCFKKTKFYLSFSSYLNPIQNAVLYLFIVSVLSNETVADIVHCGFTDVFPAHSDDDDDNNDHEVITVVKSEIINMEEMADVNETQSTDGTEVRGEENEHVTKELDVYNDMDIENGQFGNQDNDKDMEDDIYGSDDTDIADDVIFELTNEDDADDLDAGAVGLPNVKNEGKAKKAYGNNKSKEDH
jgi:hypothetical protein